MPSRQQERRKAAKRGAGQAGAAGAANVNPGGDSWTTQAENPLVLYRALGGETLKQKARQGDMEAQWSLGFIYVSQSDDNARAAGQPMGGRSALTDVGLAPHHNFTVAHLAVTR